MSNNVGRPKYRSEIDGLRCLAIIPVLLFHAGVPGFDGGFVGVDIFFVISGFLITRILITSMESGNYSLIDFYARRVRRIFPALFALLFFAIVGASVLYVPSDFASLPRTIVGAIFFVSNFVFYRLSGYISPFARIQPLLHTWSLAVEEQFYIFFPPLLFLVYRYFARNIVGAILTMAAISGILCIVQTNSGSSFAFFMPHTRAWELMAGAFFALKAFPTITQAALKEVLALTGVILIAFAVFTFDSSMLYPGARAILPVTGSCCVIYCGQDTVVGRILSLKPFVFIGWISYSLYLWHWPLIVFDEYYFATPLDGLNSAIVIGASFVAATVSWRFVEQPFRDSKRISRRDLFTMAVGASVIGCAFAAVGWALAGWPARFAPEVVRLANFYTDMAPSMTSCQQTFIDPVVPTEKLCTYGAVQPPTYALWGDSHAMAMASAMGEVASEFGKSVALFSSPGCPPANDFQPPNEPECRAFNERTQDFLSRETEIKTVILVGRYDKVFVGQQQVSLLNGLLKTVRTAQSAGKRVILMGPIPTYDYAVPRMLSQGFQRERRIIAAVTSRREFLSRIDFFWRAFDGIGGSIVRIFPDQALCPDTVCLIYDGRAALYFDEGHLSTEGARKVAQLTEGIFASK